MDSAPHADRPIRFSHMIGETDPAVPRTAAEDGAIPLVLLPGTLCDERLFAPLLARLEARTFIILPLDQCADTATMADRLLDRAPARFALLGFSLGGIVALEMAARAPDRIAGLALLDSNARAVPPADHAGRRAAAQVEPDMRAVVARLWPDYVAASARADDAVRTMVEAMADTLGHATLIRQTEIALTRTDSRPRLAALHMPALIVAGAEDALAPPALQQEIADSLPDATLALIPDAGHFAPLEAPDAVAAQVAAWLLRVDQAIARDAIRMTNPQHQEVS